VVLFRESQQIFAGLPNVGDRGVMNRTKTLMYSGSQASCSVSPGFTSRLGVVGAERKTEPTTIQLFHSQRAAVARLQYAALQESSLAVLCGPGGSGVSTVMSALVTRLHEASHVVQIDVRQAEVSSQVAACKSAGNVVVTVDNCHLATVGMLGAVFEAIWMQSPRASVILGGRGRLMTVLSRDRGLVDKVLLRSVIHPLSVSETRSIVETHLTANGYACSESVWLVIHQIAAGILEDVFRLVAMARVVAGSQPNKAIQADDIEQIHERLHAAAA